MRHRDPFDRLVLRRPRDLGLEVLRIRRRRARVDDEDAVARVDPGAVRRAEPAIPGVRIGLRHLEREQFGSLRFRRLFRGGGVGDENEGENGERS